MWVPLGQHRVPLAVPELSFPVVSQAVREIKGWPAGLGAGSSDLVQVRLGGRLVWENKAGWLQTRGGWWLRSLPLHLQMGAWLGEENRARRVQGPEGTRGARSGPLKSSAVSCSGRYGGLELAKAGHGSTRHLLWAGTLADAFTS